jgi:hypothetical protein
MNLTIKKECEGLIIKRNCMAYGQVTFDYYKVLPEHYINYHKLGFPIFEETKPKKK